MHATIKQMYVVVLLACATVFAPPAPSCAQETRLSLEQRVAQLERLVLQLQQRIAQLEARLTATPAKAPRIDRAGDWRDKGAWRKLRKGMTMDEVSALIGEPEKVSAGTYTIYWYWGYPGGAQVTFDAKSNLVDGWSEP